MICSSPTIMGKPVFVFLPLIISQLLPLPISLSCMRSPKKGLFFSLFDKKIKHEKTESGFRFECPIDDTTNLVIIAVQSVSTISFDVSGGGNVTTGSGEGLLGKAKTLFIATINS